MINQLTAHETADLILSGEISSGEAVEACLERIDTVEPVLHSFIEVDREGALETARGIDRRIKKGENPGKLAGVPVALKDIYCVQGKEVTCGSRILKGFRAPYDATVIRKLREEGAVFIGQIGRAHV